MTATTVPPTTFGRRGAARPARTPAPSAASDAPLDRELFALYVGPNSTGFERVLDRMEAENANLKRTVISWSWPGLLVPLPWLMYRKQWNMVAAILLIPVITSYVLNLGSANSFLTFFVAVGGKSFYVADAARRIRKLQAQEADPARRRELVARAGGVSVAGAVAGTVVMLAAALLVVAAKLAR